MLQRLVAAGLARRCGATLSVDEDDNRTTFTLEFSTNLQAAQPTPSAALGPCSTRHLGAVDRVLCITASPGGMETLSGARGALTDPGCARDRIEREPWDLVVLDLRTRTEAFVPLIVWLATSGRHVPVAAVLPTSEGRRPHGIERLDLIREIHSDSLSVALSNLRSLALERAPRILCVDDDTFFMKLLTKTLQQSSGRYSIQQARNGIDLFQYLEKFIPDMILLDLHMPGMDGLEICRFLKSRKTLRSIPVIVITGSPRQEDLERARGAGADRVLTKPLSRVSLELEMENLLGQGARSASN